MSGLRALTPLLIAAGILLAGNGLFSTLIAVRGAEEGMSASQIGWMGTTYFAGFLVGCMISPKLLQMVGHIRTFAALASLAAGFTLLMVMVVNPYMWMLDRLIIGFSFAGLFTTIESWLNSSVTNADRGRVTGLYRVIDIAVVSGAQFMMPIFGTSGFVLFAIIAMMTSFSLIPVAVADRSSPKPPEVVKFDVPAIWAISPLACAGCVVIGMTNSAFRFIGPIYAQSIGLDISSVATFISLGVIGGAVLQYPLGILSDRVERRLVLLLTTLGAVFSGLFLSFYAGSVPTLVYLGIFFFGAFSLPLYSLSAAHANDRANKDQFVLLAAGLMFFYGLGAALGPPVSSLLVDTQGPNALFLFTSVAHAMLVVMSIWRIRSRDAVPTEARGRFRILLRTSPVMQRLVRNKSTGNDKTDNGSK